MATLKVTSQPANQPTLVPTVRQATPQPLAGVASTPVQPRLASQVASQPASQPTLAPTVASTPSMQPAITSVGTADNQRPVTPKLSLAEFAQTIKKKYPQYQNVDDTELATKILEKYPEYKSKVIVPEAPTPADSGNLFTDIVEGFAKPFARLGVSAYNAAAAPVSAINSLAQGRGAAQAMQDFTKEADASRTIGSLTDVQPLLKVDPAAAGDPYGIKTGASAAGAAAEIAANFVGGTGAVKVGTTTLRGAVKEGLKEGLKYGFAGGGLSGFGQGLQTDNPIIGALIYTPVGAATGGVLGGGLGAVLPAIGGATRAALGTVFPEVKLNMIKNEFAGAVDETFNKAFRPSMAGIKTAEQLKAANQRNQLGVATILDALNNQADNPEAVSELLPKTVAEALEVTSATKKQIFQTYTNQAEAAGERAVQVELTGIADALERVANDPRIADGTPATAQYARDLAARLRERGVYDPATAEDVLATFNSRLQAFYRNPNPNEANNAFVDNFVANNLRELLDTKVSTLTAPRYGQLRQQYGALADMEKTLSRRVGNLSKQAEKGFFDFADVLGAGDLVQGLVTGNPVSAARGLATRGVGKYLKYLNDPDRLTAKLFQDANKVFQKSRKLILPSQTIPLPQELPAARGTGAKVQNNVPMQMPARVRPLEGGTRVRTEVNPQLLLPEQASPTPISPTQAIEQPARVRTNSAAETQSGLRRIGGPGSRRTIQERNLAPRATTAPRATLDPAMEQAYRQRELKNTLNSIGKQKLYAGSPGLLAGFDVDENGELKYDPKKAGVGLAIGAVATNRAMQKTIFEGFKDITTKVLNQLVGKSIVSKQFISDLTNTAGLKQVERDLVRDILKDYPEGAKIPAQEFADKMKTQLLPLQVLGEGQEKLSWEKLAELQRTAKKSGRRQDWAAAEEYEESLTAADLGRGEMGVKGSYNKYENVALPDTIRGNVADYAEHVYESPIQTSAGDVHFGSMTDNYFGHTRLEDMKGGNVRRVIEVQSDLYQKGNLEKEALGYNSVDEFNKDYPDQNFNKAEREQIKNTQKLKPYRNTWHERLIREEVKRAAQDGKTKLLFPTGKTAMDIEGLGGAESTWFMPNPDTASNENWLQLKPTDLKVGAVVNNRNYDDWIITDVLGDGKFKAVEKSWMDAIAGMLENYKTEKSKTQFIQQSIGDKIETFDISGKSDENNPIYRFYEKEVSKYLKNRYNARFVTDDKGVTWWEVSVPKEAAKSPIEAFAALPAVPAALAGSKLNQANNDQ